MILFLDMRSCAFRPPVAYYWNGSLLKIISETPLTTEIISKALRELFITTLMPFTQIDLSYGGRESYIHCVAYMCSVRVSHSPLTAVQCFYASGDYPWLPAQGLLNRWLVPLISRGIKLAKENLSITSSIFDIIKIVKLKFSIFTYRTNCHLHIWFYKRSFISVQFIPLQESFIIPLKQFNTSCQTCFN